MSGKLFILLAIAGCAVTGCLTSKGEATPQTKPDKMPSVIVYAVDAIDPEKKAADELKTYLTNISGGNYSLQAEDKALDGASAIYVGQTVFAKKAGIDLGAFAEEEYPPHCWIKPDHRRRSAQRHLEWRAVFFAT